MVSSAFQATAFGSGVMIVVGLFCWLRWGWNAAVNLSMVFSCTVFPIAIWGGEDDYHVGVSESALTIRTFTVTLVVVAALLATSRGLRGFRVALPFLAYIGFGWSYMWERSDTLVSGIAQYASGPLAFCVARIANEGQGRSRSLRTLMSVACSLIIVANALACVLNVLGVNLVGLAAGDDQYVAGRANGLTNHPNTLGKFVVILTSVLLANSGIKVDLARRALKVGLPAGLVCLLLSQGRANATAWLLLVLVFAYLSPGLEGARRRFSASFLTIFSIAALWAVLSSRFREDPAGGARNELIDYWTEIQGSAGVWGVGPNLYTQASSYLFGSTIPVHNSFLLAFAELGAVGSILLFAPLILAAVAAIKSGMGEGMSGDAGRALVGLLLATVLIGLSGWGMLGSSVLPLWMFVSGMLAGWSGLSSEVVRREYAG